MTSIGSNAFYGCNALTNINIERVNDGTLTGAPWGAPKATVSWKNEEI